MIKCFLYVLLFFSFPLSAQDNSYVFVFLNKKLEADKISKEETDKLMAGHMANMQRLAAEKKLLAAGPFEGGGGIFIFHSNSTDTVSRWIETDPAVRAKRWNIEILSYKPITGGICPVGEKYEMTTYQFIRFWPEIKKYTVAEAPQILAQHEAYWKKQAIENSFITFATFGDYNGDIIIANAFDDNLISDDPGIKTGLIQFNKKALWVAKGSFCESK